MRDGRRPFCKRRIYGYIIVQKIVCAFNTRSARRMRAVWGGSRYAWTTLALLEPKPRRAERHAAIIHAPTSLLSSPAFCCYSTAWRKNTSNTDTTRPRNMRPKMGHTAPKKKSDRRTTLIRNRTKKHIIHHHSVVWTTHSEHVPESTYI